MEYTVVLISEAAGAQKCERCLLVGTQQWCVLLLGRKNVGGSLGVVVTRRESTEPWEL